MKSRPAELSAGLVAIKGAAAPAAAATSPKASARAPARKAAAEPEAKEANLTPLNFRISASFRREFRTYAATHDLKLNELLRLCFEAYRRQHRD
jgi:hypothetical protein